MNEKELDARRLLFKLGYDPDDPVPRDDEGQRILPDRLLESLGAAPVVPEGRIDGLASGGGGMKHARDYARRHTSR